MFVLSNRITRGAGAVSCVALLCAACDSSRVSARPLLTDGLSTDFSSFCTVDPLRACASTSLDATYVGDGSTVLRVRFQNTQGTNPHDNTGGWRLSHLAFGTREQGGSVTGFASFGPSGAVGTYGNPDLAYPFDPVAPLVPDPGGGPPVPGVVLAWHNATQMHGIVGCTPLPLDSASAPKSFPFLGAWQTCPASGFGGAFDIAIRMSWEPLEADSLFVRWSGYTTTGEFVTCDTRAPDTCAPTSLGTVTATAARRPATRPAR